MAFGCQEYILHPTKLKSTSARRTFKTGKQADQACPQLKLIKFGK